MFDVERYLAETADGKLVVQEALVKNGIGAYNPIIVVQKE
jgi:hypothetical protein